MARLLAIIFAIAAIAIAAWWFMTKPGIMHLPPLAEEVQTGQATPADAEAEAAADAAADAAAIAADAAAEATQAADDAGLDATSRAAQDAQRAAEEAIEAADRAAEAVVESPDTEAAAEAAKQAADAAREAAEATAEATAVDAALTTEGFDADRLAALIDESDIAAAQKASLKALITAATSDEALRASVIGQIKAALK